MVGLEDAEYTLYSSPFSLYSMMARHTIQLGRTTKGGIPPKSITLSLVNNRKLDNLKEDYIVNLNPKGQIPTLAGNVLERPLTDSISISLYLAENHYPELLPAKHAPVIRDLLTRIHAIPGPSISNRNPSAEMIKHNHSPVEDILKRTDLDPVYRNALEQKLKFHDQGYGIAFHPDVVKKAHADVRTIFAEIIDLRKQSGAFTNQEEWTFGAKVGPTVLDSHLLPLALRCIEVFSTELVPEELRLWAKAKEKSPTWEKVMHGRPTTYDPSMGPIEDMHEMLTL